MQEGLFRRRRLPHWDVEDGTYFVTACLEGSLSTQGLDDLYRYRNELEARAKPAAFSNDDWELHKHKLMFARFDDIMDEQPLVKHLQNPDAANTLRDALFHFAGDRYDLIAYVVMPSHFHWVFHPRRQWVEPLVRRRNSRTPRERLTKSIKGYSAFRCNRLLRTGGTFWQDESYDHIVRDDDELLRIIEYVERNPVKAKLVSEPEGWRWSSAADRAARGLKMGDFLVK